MLSKLFGSRARVKILKIFLHHPDKKFYIRQLARDLDLQVNSVRRELENLEEFGLLKSFVGNTDEPGESVEASSQEKKFYQIDKSFILFEEIRALILKSQVLHERDFVERIKALGKVKLLVLTGIFTNNKDAGADILVVGDINKPKFMKIIKELEFEVGGEINYTLMDQREFKYRREMTDVFLFKILEGKKMVAIDELEVF